MTPATPPGPSPPSARLTSFFQALIDRRWAILALYALLLPAGVWLSLQVGSDNSIDRLIVQSDDEYRANQEFQRIFPEGEQAILLAQTLDPFTGEVQEKVREIETALAAIPGVSAFSALDLPARGGTAGFRAFATGTDLFRRQGLVGPDFLGIALDLKADGAEQRDAALAAIDAALAPFEARPAPLTRIRRIGGPWVDAWLEKETGRASLTYFPLFGLFLIVINLSLYRSVRTLAAFLATLAVCVALGVGFAHLAGFTFTIVSSLVPLTILITSTAALVYIQSRFIERSGGRSIEEHQVFTLANKFLATTASIFAAAIGFAALAVSGIRPIHDMGLWVAAGLVITWVVVFTLFPALQRILRVPAREPATGRPRAADRVLDRLPLFTWRWRWALLAGSLVLMAAGAVALLGIPGWLAPMRLETDSLAYIDRSLPIYEDTRRFEQAVSGLSMIQIRITAPAGSVLRPDLLRGMEWFGRELESDPRVGSVTGPTTLLRWAGYMTGQGDRLPDDPARWPDLAAQLDQVLLEQPAARGYVDVAALSDARLSMVYRGERFAGVDELKRFVSDCWSRAASRVPEILQCRMQVVGQGLLQARIAEYLVPTLTESFALTAGIIFVAFLVVFRSGSARLMAMIPSLFAILVMFLFMRVTGIPLNVATILVASTVLGASENDQIHFFYHYQEKRGDSTESALRHALRIAGRGILFATLINAGGFLALAMSRLPPMRQFGIITSSAFALSMVASLTALPAALWILSGEAPSGERPQAAGRD